MEKLGTADRVFIGCRVSFIELNTVKYCNDATFFKGNKATEQMHYAQVKALLNFLANENVDMDIKLL